MRGELDRGFCCRRYLLDSKLVVLYPDAKREDRAFHGRDHLKQEFLLVRETGKKSQCSAASLPKNGMSLTPPGKTNKPANPAVVKTEGYSMLPSRFLIRTSPLI